MFNLLIFLFFFMFNFNNLYAETITKNCTYKSQTGEKKLSIKINKKDKIINDKFNFDNSSTDKFIRWSSWFKIQNSLNYNVHFLELDLEENHLHYVVANDLDISIDNRMGMLSNNIAFKILDNVTTDEDYNIKLDNKIIQLSLFLCN